MTTDTLRMIYYAFFHSIANYGIIAWGGAYANNLNLLQRLQNRLLKIINKNNFINNKNPLRLDQQFVFESLSYHYNELKNKFLESTSTTRKKQLRIPIMKKIISNKMSLVIATSVFNQLPNELKTLKISKKANKSIYKIKEWIKNNT